MPCKSPSCCFNRLLFYFIIIERERERERETDVCVFKETKNQRSYNSYKIRSLLAVCILRERERVREKER